MILFQGAGCGLLSRRDVLMSMVKDMKSVMNIPLSVKTRMGLQTDQPITHTLVEDLAKAGADVLMV